MKVFVAKVRRPFSKEPRLPNRNRKAGQGDGDQSCLSPSVPGPLNVTVKVTLADVRMAAGAGAGGAATPTPRQLSSPCAAVSPKHERRHGALWFVVPSAGAGFFLRVEYLGVGIRGRRGASEGPPPTLSITEMVKTQIFLPDVGPCQQADMSSAPSDAPHSCRQRRVGRTHPSWGHRVLRGDTVSTRLGGFAAGAPHFGQPQVPVHSAALQKAWDERDDGTPGFLLREGAAGHGAAAALSG